MKNDKQIKDVLDRISTALSGYLDHEENPGLMTGYCGTALFYAYYHRLTGKSRHLKMVDYIVKKAVTALSQQEMIYSHCSGISGILWCIQHLLKNGFIHQDEPGEIFAEADTVLRSYINEQLSEDHYDFLHEGLGVTLYFLDRLPDPEVERYLKNVVAQLANSSISNTNGISWKDTFTSRSRQDDLSLKYNLGLAHGMPSILSVLGMLYEKGIEKDKTLSLLQQGVHWLLSTKNGPGSDCVSVFPTLVTAGSEAIGSRQSRLGWCYGDLGIAICLWNLGRRLKNDSFKKEAYTVFRHTLTYRNKENGHINDASLCHGSMGVSHIFRRMYHDTGETVFLNGAEHWLNQAVELTNPADGLAGFQYLTAGGYQDNYNLLEGITGIGLGLTAALDERAAPAWDRCLLLS